ncbi:helix-turn-helix domain-containing protein [Bradyrhizobium sp. 1(2017)]|uniref:helix-turn-helix domain-containing protein n=1 Tax=Bradyrhizobium sp. 1(2017) TaxID=1404888 RepID=UPI00140EC844|nr:helix-turn-helix transcriptional regulator [Bradyrhizobium sp. 1(2017)]QIO34657.1 helix-turn-helix transcriptional regulator [Bradyrhizobium sp. 1(2017)]
MTFEIKELSQSEQADFKADGRMRAYLSMKRAFKKRASESGVTVKSLAKAIDRDKGQVSRILSGRSAGVTLDTLVLITSALGFRLSFDAIPVETMHKRNRNVAPANWQKVEALKLKDNPRGLAVYVTGTTKANTGSTYFKYVDNRK